MTAREHIILKNHEARIRALVADHIHANVVFAKSRHALGNRLALSLWGRPGMEDTICLVQAISAVEQLSVILDIGRKARDTGLTRFYDLAQTLSRPSQDLFIQYLLLHEIAHIKHNWGDNKEIECHLWAMDRLGLPLPEQSAPKG